jgi:hypothetical protein
MNTRTSIVILFICILSLVPLVTNAAFAEAVLSVKMDEARQCEKLALSAKRYPGGIGTTKLNPDGYTVDEVWMQRDGIVGYFYNEEKGIICFQPLSIGSTRVRVSGTINGLDSYGRPLWEKKFYRSFKVRVRQ